MWANRGERTTKKDKEVTPPMHLTHKKRTTTTRNMKEARTQEGVGSPQTEVDKREKTTPPPNPTNDKRRKRNKPNTEEKRPERRGGSPTPNMETIQIKGVTPPTPNPQEENDKHKKHEDEENQKG